MCPKKVAGAKHQPLSLFMSRCEFELLINRIRRANHIIHAINDLNVPSKSIFSALKYNFSA